MLYEDYLVTDCCVKDGNGQKIYYCEMVGKNNHRINFSLIIQGCVGEREYSAQYEAVTPHICVGDLLHCEFAWQWHDSCLNLCLSGFIKTKAHRVGSCGLGEVISPQDYFNANRSYWVTTNVYGQWVRFPGLIHCGGDAFVHTNFERAYPEFGSYLSDSAKGALVWKPKLVKNGSVDRVRKAIGRFIPLFARV